ncbi:ubiquinone biosynthesis monooxygenase Coq7 [Piedraia hortae CBS 480.64]|uniref:5-demethoxyubiquinone hydroxylase, mitochondrial n=1 Tax=Piedraia hortae CBS 480.64 TaxID=1314780 RepID=A0A6A7BVE8_9PEZI|nr:ubiquinone biosynthesis monooxygenase Coq7 [Piedraia hortae CBS 480.64]
MATTRMAARRAFNPPIVRQYSTCKSLTPSQKEYLSSALRVNHAGELAATLIYAAQTPVILRSYPHLRGLMQHMYDQEAGHKAYFDDMLVRHRVRPTAMYPVWYVASTALGWATGMMGREAAMACTEAVETEIGEHYNNQVRELMKWMREMEERGEDVGEELKALTANLRRIRDEELEHLDHAVEHDAKQANPYDLLTTLIRWSCRGAIKISEKI